ncbi:unnamed protein product [Brachionus calyciflorus]|uniref:Uncharacterized protein n=1 Tax=Brachionus calyciflorus TaxID=104777 RepID=A0A813Y8Z0_9BILA|nr:unnamed protein product [Brachionus calyciflorus]
MNHSRVINKCLKYLNATFAVLMIVVLSLNIEQIFHNKRISNLDSVNSSHLRESLNICRRCQIEAIQTLTSLNIEGAFLSTVLASYSIVFAFKNEMFRLHYKWLIPGCLISAILTCVYFIIVITTRISSECLNNKKLELLWECDADFYYSMEHKVIPLSILMLVCIPQFIARSFSLLAEKCVRKDSKNGICNSWYSVEMDKEPSRPYLKRKISFEINSDLKPHNEMNILQRSPVIFGFRELPVDCPFDETSDKINLPKIEFFNDESDLLIDTENSDQIVANNMKPNVKFSNSKRLFVRNSSLSTISEERTFATMTEMSEAKPDINPSSLVCSVINDFQEKATFMNEIIHVFQPSSKGGCFSRNVPIRLTSPRKSFSPINSPISIRSSSTTSPEFEFDLTNNLERSLLVSNIILAKKIRFVKRLKIRIETKKGKKISKNREFKLNRHSPLSSLNRKSLKKKKFLSFNSIQGKEFRKSIGEVNFGLNVSGEKVDLQKEVQKIPNINNIQSIQPVFF